jgi:uncharacterized protein YcfL
MIRTTTVILASTLLALAGCATPQKMDLTRETQQVDVSKKSVVLISAEIANLHKPDYQPGATVVHVEKPNADKSEDRLNFAVDAEGTEVTKSGNRYLLRVSIEPGKYVLRGISGTSGNFPVRGMFFMPLHVDLDVVPGSIIYAGRIQGRIRARDEGKNEFRAGSVIPLIDQSVTGFSSGTFDVTVMDVENEDLARFRSAFPALRASKIVKQVLPPFNRAVAQSWWESR